MEAATAAAETLCSPPHPEGGTVARLAAGADLKPAGRAFEEPVAGGDESMAVAPPPRLHGRLQALRARAERNGLVSSPPPGELARRPFAAPLGSLPVRVRALADWMNECFDPEALFVADDLGQPLVEFRGGAKLLAAATVLADAAAKAQRHLPGAAEAAVVHLTLGQGQVLSLVSAGTVLGRWHAGLTTQSPISEPAARELAQSMCAAAAG